MIVTIMSSGFHLRTLSFYYTFYYYSLRHPEDGHEYDRNMLMISRM